MWGAMVKPCGTGRTAIVRNMQKQTNKQINKQINKQTNKTKNKNKKKYQCGDMFSICWFCELCWLHTTKNISPSPTLQFGGVFCIDVDQGSLINKKKWKIALACLFFVVDALIWCLSQQISVKKSIFIKNWEIWELFILFLLQQSRTTEY